MDWKSLHVLRTSYHSLSALNSYYSSLVLSDSAALSQVYQAHPPTLECLCTHCSICLEFFYLKFQVTIFLHSFSLYTILDRPYLNIINYIKHHYYPQHSLSIYCFIFSSACNHHLMVIHLIFFQLSVLECKPHAHEGQHLCQFYALMYLQNM